MSADKSVCDQTTDEGAFEEFEKARQELHEHVS